LQADDVSWVAGHASGDGALAAKTRYRQADAACTLRSSAGRITLHFEQPQWAVTPGQSAVLYDGDVCLGGGVITAADVPAIDASLQRVAQVASAPITRKATQE
jgi:tRNA-uridine 2-sulfurtransferase